VAQHLAVTGTLNPDTTGVYVENGVYGGQPAYERADSAYWIWWDGAQWVISSVAGTSGAAYWTGAAIAGTYNPGGIASGTATVAILDRYWLGTTSTDHAVAANWATTSGGAGGASVPGTGNPVYFDGNGNNACTVTANWTHGGFVTAAGYTAKLDLATFNLVGDDGVSVTLDGAGDFDNGTGSHSITNGTLDFRHTGDFTRGTSTWTLNGTCTLTGFYARPLYDLTIAAGATVDASSSTDVNVAHTLTVDGSLDMGAADWLTINSGGDVVINAGGVITGSGTAQLRFTSPTSGNGLITQDGTVSIPTVFVRKPVAGAILRAATYGSLLKVTSDAAGTHVLELDAAGAYVFDDVELENTSTGSLTLANDTNGPASITTGDLTIDLDSSGDITVDDGGVATDWNISGDVIDEITGGGTFTYTKGNGTFTASGTADQTWDFNGQEIEPLSVVKGTSGSLTLTDVVTQLADVNIADAGGLTITGSTITSTADAKAITGAFDIGIASNNVNMGSTTWTLTDCALDYDDIGTLTAPSAAVTFAGTCTIQANDSSWFAPTTIAASGTTTVLAVGDNWKPSGVIVNGTLSVESGETVVVNPLLNTVLNTGGRITGAGTFRVDQPINTKGLTVHDGTIDIAFFEVREPIAGAVVAPGTFACTDRFKVISSSAFDHELELNGTYVFDCDFEVENTGVGDMEIKNSTNNPNITFQKGVIWDQQAGSITWTKGTGTNTFAGANAQDADFGSAAIEAVVVNKTNVTDELTFSGGWTATSFTATKGTIDYNGQTLATVGNFTMGVDSQVVSDADAMNGTAITVGGNLALDGSDGDLLTFNATAGWTITVTGTTDANWVEVEYSDASGGTEVIAIDNCVDGGNNTNWYFGVIELSPVTVAWSVTVLGLSKTIIPAAVSATWSIVAPGLSSITSPLSVSANWSVVVPGLGKITKPSAISVTWSVIASGLLKTIKPSPTEAMWSVITPKIILSSKLPVGLLTSGHYGIGA